MIEQLASRLARLEDIEAIRGLIAAYGPLADAGKAQAMAALFAPEGVYSVHGFSEAKGRAAIAALLSTPTHLSLMADGCAHFLGPASITLDGDRATAVGYSVVFRHDAGQFLPARVAANRWEFARIGGEWQVLRRDNALLDGTEQARLLLSPPIAPHPQQTRRQ